MIPRHPLCALSSLTYIAFHTRCKDRDHFTSKLKYSRTLFFPYSIGNVPARSSLSLTEGSHSGPARTADRLRRCLVHQRERSIVRTASSAIRLRPAPLNKIGLMHSGRLQVCHQIVAIKLRGSGSSSGGSCFFLAASLVAAPDRILPPLPPSSQLSRLVRVVEPRRLELLTPSLQRRCSPN